MSRRIKEIDNVLDGSISLMIGDFEVAMRSMGWGGITEFCGWPKDMPVGFDPPTSEY